MSVNADTMHKLQLLYVIECMGIVFIKIAGIGKHKVKFKLKVYRLYV